MTLAENQNATLADIRQEYKRVLLSKQVSGSTLELVMTTDLRIVASSQPWVHFDVLVNGSAKNLVPMTQAQAAVTLFNRISMHLCASEPLAGVL